MICVSIQEQDLQKCKEILKSSQMAEIRADLCKFPTDVIEQLVEQHSNIIITSRIENSTQSLAYEQITRAIIKGAKYVDIEIEAPDTHLEYIKSYARANGCKLIISYHNFACTNSLDELTQIYDLCLRKGADIVKIVTTAHNISDAAMVLSLYKSGKYLSGNKKNLVAFAMGEAGKFTRHLCLTLGSPYTYVSYDYNNATAPGQYTKKEIEELLDGNNYKFTFNRNNLDKTDKTPPSQVIIPCSKSVAQRAILAAAIAEGESKLNNFAPCNDINGAIEVVKRLGSKVELKNNTITIQGATEQGLGNLTKIEVGESGLLTRLLIPFATYLSGLKGNEIEITGHGSILKRDLSESVRALEAAGAGAQSTNNGHLPFNISCTICNNSVEFSGKESSQIVSGFLMTLPLLQQDTTLTITNPTSIPYIELTLKTLKQFGIEIQIIENTPHRIVYKIRGRQKYKAAEVYMDSDWSSAAYFAVAGAIAGEITLLHMPLNSSQADEAILEILKQCGAEIVITAGEDKNLSNITITGGELYGFNFDATNCPDLFPILATLASHCKGESSIKGVNRLLQKESNRAETIFTEFTTLGGEINIIDDYMYIGGKNTRGGQLHGGRVRGHNDHRIAMSLIIAGLFTEEPVIIDDIKCIDKSFPSFMERLLKKIK